MKLRHRIIPALLSLSLFFCTGAQPLANVLTVSYAQSASYSDTDAAADYVREQLRQHNSGFTVTVPNPTPNGRDTDVIFDAVCDALLSAALEETGRGDEGDYIRYSLYSYGLEGTVSRSTVSVTFATVEYNSSAAQEAAVTKKLADVTDSLSLGGKSDYEKIKTIYGYITSHVDYATDLSSRIVYSSYGALINGSAVCQGYSLLLYRMLTEAGISSRIVVGKGNGGNHAWNIAELDGKYYYLDSTWDEGQSAGRYGYFLRGTSDLDSVYPINTHSLVYSSAGQSVLFPDWTSAELKAQYPMAETAYDPTAALTYTLGDVNGDGIIDSVDASLILVANARQSYTDRMLLAGDIDHNGMVDPVDASLILCYNAYVADNGTLSISEYVKTL